MQLRARIGMMFQDIPVVGINVYVALPKKVKWRHSVPVSHHDFYLF